MLSPVKRLYLLRHAKSSWDDRSLADEDRPLAPRGRKAAKKLSACLQRQEIRPDLVVCSPALRTRQTLDLLGDALGPDTPTHIEPELYAADEETLLAVVRGLPADAGSALLIGHNPGLQWFGVGLARSGEALDRLREKMPTAALARIDLDVERWSDAAPGTGVLAGYVIPADL